MTIDEYLSQPRKLKRKCNRLYKIMQAAELKATSPRDPLNLGDGIPGRKSGGNSTEDRLLDYINANQDYCDAYQQYKAIRDEIETTIDNLLYWQGRLIYHVYIYNVFLDEADDLHGAEDILNTNSRREILAKLAEAKAALADLLRAQGVEIE